MAGTDLNAELSSQHASRCWSGDHDEYSRVSCTHNQPLKITDVEDMDLPYHYSDNQFKHWFLYVVTVFTVITLLIE